VANGEGDSQCAPIDFRFGNGHEFTVSSDQHTAVDVLVGEINLPELRGGKTAGAEKNLRHIAR
ncbi:MAG: hypothetical protein ACK55I_01390, partial [bacterium]